MITALNETIIADRYVPELNRDGSLVIVASQHDKYQFLYETVMYYTPRAIPLLFIADPLEVAAFLSEFDGLQDYDQSKDITYHADDLDSLYSMLVRNVEKHLIRPIVICLNDLPEQFDENTKNVFQFIDKIKELHIQSYLFADKKYDYLDAQKNIAEVDYFLSTREDKTLIESPVS